MTLVRGIYTDMDFGKWIKIKQISTIEEFNWKENQFLRLEEAYMIEGKPVGEQSKVVIQSNVEVKQDGKFSKLPQEMRGKLRNWEKKVRILAGVMRTGNA